MMNPAKSVDPKNLTNVTLLIQSMDYLLSTSLLNDADNINKLWLMNSFEFEINRIYGKIRKLQTNQIFWK